MDCPHCGFSQPEGVECVQCHSPLGELADLLRELDLEPPTREMGLDSHTGDPFAAPDIDVAPAPAATGTIPKPTPSPEMKALSERVQRVRLTTAPGYSGLAIRAYRGLVTAQVMVHMDAHIGVSDAHPVVSLRATDMGQHLSQALAVAVGDLRLATVKAGGNAVISVAIDYQVAAAGTMLLTLSGTAVEVTRERRGA